MADKIFPTDFTAEASPTLDQYVMVSNGSSARKVLNSDYAALLATSAAVQPGPVDVPATTAFATSQTLPAPAAISSSGLTNAELTTTVSVDFPGGGVLALDADDGTAYATGVWFADEAVEVDEVDEIEAYIATTTPTLGDECYVGLVFCADATTGNAITCTVGVDAAGVAGLIISRGDAPGGAQLATAAISVASGWLRIKMLGTRPVTADPPAMLFLYEFTSASDGSQARGTLTTGTINGGAPWTASWDTAACNRVGIVLQAGAGAVAPIAGIVTGFRIKRKVAA